MRVKLGDTGEYRIVDNMTERGDIHEVGNMRYRGGERPSAYERGKIEDLRLKYPNKRIIFHDKKGIGPSLIDPDLYPDWKPAPPKYRKW